MSSVVGGKMKFRILIAALAFLTGICLLPRLALADAIIDTLSFYQQGGNLSNAPSYYWDYGCSPTAAGMMMGFYDRNGYAGYTYNNLVPGGTAESSTWPLTHGSSSPLADSVIASQGYIHDFYADDHNRGFTNYLHKNDDVKTQFHSFNSLGDFMGTSQDSAGNSDGMTAFYYFMDGYKFTAQDAVTYGVWNKDGMFGIAEYFSYAGYAANLGSFFTQHIYDSSDPYGFTFANYVAEINAGRVVMIQLDGHSMFGYGYGTGNTIDFYDTWSNTPQTMTWGGSYSGMTQWGVTCFTPYGGQSTIPESSTFTLLSSGCLGLFLLVRFKKARA
jgi:hypothetical protein